MTLTYPWHREVVQRIATLRDKDQLPNAIALTCAPGWGHESLLSEVALMLLGDAAEREVEEFAHPDFRWIVPDGAVIKIDQVRHLNDFAVQTAHMAPRKVAAIVDAHLLNANAANALLKTLEEPPPNTHVLLATPYWGRLLPTIRSRCQRFASPPDSALARAWLQQQNVDLSESQFAEFGYAPLTAHAQLAQDRTDLTAWLCALDAGSLSNAVEQVLNMDLVLWLGRWYRRLLIHLAGESIPQCAVPAGGILDFCDELLSVRRQIESSNAANARLLLEHLIVRWLQLQRRGAR